MTCTLLGFRGFEIVTFIYYFGALPLLLRHYIRYLFHASITFIVNVPLGL